MNRIPIMACMGAVCLILAGCEGREGKRASTSDEPAVFTEDIQAGIKAHIEEQTRLGDGYMRLSFEGKELKLRLVRIHTEYLANLGPNRHFACIDLASTEGDVYDVDFFLKGKPGTMTVTETTIHKVNGQPLYAWKQHRDKTWHRVAVETAPPRLLGVLKGNDQFEFVYKAVLPEISGNARMWIPLPSSDAFQTVQRKVLDAPGRWEVLTETEHGNRVLFTELGPQDSGETVLLRFGVHRLEKGPYAAEESDMQKYLKAEQLIPLNEQFRTIAEEVVEGKSGDLVRARALYDHVIDRMRYAKFGPGWGQGDAVFACNAGNGNCTDFHSYFIALARAVGIPSRFAIGAAIPSERDAGGVNGYHCWAEFYSDGKWWPVDISEADKCSTLSTYYFGHHPANRIELSRGRDIAVEPGPSWGPINFLAYPVLEMDGKPAKTEVEFSFERRRFTKS